MNMNKAILMGRLTKAPEIKYTQSGKAVASFTLAIDRRRSAGGEKQADFISCVAWEKLAETIGNYCVKGQQIAVEGRIQSRSYDAQDGSKRYVTEVVVSGMEFCGKKSDHARADASGAEGSSMGYPGEEIPF